MKPPKTSPLPRISFRNILENILEQLNLERGIGYTIKKLIIDPYGAVREFLFYDRRRMMKPIPLMLLTVAIATFATLQWLPESSDLSGAIAEDPNLRILPPKLRELTLVLSEFTRQYFNIAFMSSLPFTSLATFIVFREQGLNFAEHLVINIYLFSIQNLIVILLLPPIAIWRLDWLALFMGIAIMAYFVYSYTRVFEQKWLRGFFNTLLVFLIYQFFYGLTILIISLIIVQFF